MELKSSKFTKKVTKNKTTKSTWVKYFNFAFSVRKILGKILVSSIYQTLV